MMSFDRKSQLSTNAFFSLNPGDLWIEDVTFEEYYMLITNVKAGIAVAATTGWNPIDTVQRNMMWKNFNISIKNPDKESQRFFAFGGGAFNDVYATTISNVTNINIHDFYGGAYFAFYYTWSPSDTVFINDFVADNYVLDSFLTTIVVWGSVVMENITFKNVANMPYQTILTQFNQKIEMKDIYVLNYTGSNSPIGPILTFNDFPTVNIKISGLHVENSNLYKSALLKNIQIVRDFTVDNVVFKDMTISSGYSILIFENVGHLTFSNHSYTRVTNSDQTSEGSSIIQLISMNMGNGYEEELFKVSSHF
jgi:hypothetical protein